MIKITSRMILFSSSYITRLQRLNYRLRFMLWSLYQPDFSDVVIQTFCSNTKALYCHHAVWCSYCATFNISHSLNCVNTHFCHLFTFIEKMYMIMQKLHNQSVEKRNILTNSIYMGFSACNSFLHLQCNKIMTGEVKQGKAFLSLLFDPSSTWKCTDTTWTK